MLEEQINTLEDGTDWLCFCVSVNNMASTNGTKLHAIVKLHRVLTSGTFALNIADVLYDSFSHLFVSL